MNQSLELIDKCQIGQHDKFQDLQITSEFNMTDLKFGDFP